MRQTNIASLVAAAFLAMAAATAAAQQANHDIRIVLPEQPGNLESCGTIITTVGQVLSQNVTESLTVINTATGQPEPKLATKWEQLNPMTWRLTLREGVKFQDGADFNAKAVAFSIDRMTGGKLSGSEAVRIGLATETNTDPYAGALALASTLAERSPDSVAAAKRLFNRTWSASDRRTFRWERLEQARLLLGANAAEARRAATRRERPAYKPRAGIDPRG